MTMKQSWMGHPNGIGGTGMAEKEWANHLQNRNLEIHMHCEDWKQQVHASQRARSVGAIEKEVHDATRKKTI